MKIKMLMQEDWKIWKKFRLEALKNSPENFGDSYEEVLNWTDSDFQETIAKNDVFCMFNDYSIVSCAGFYVLNLEKTNCYGVVWGLYTHPDYRGKGLASALMQKVFVHAKSRVRQLHLKCITSNLSAIAFYQKQGFKIYGMEPRTLKVGDIFFDTHLMVLDLEKNP
jgi:ribosomal protein S18 acetylase RimI-like enzyme